jgi:Phage integrase family
MPADQSELSVPVRTSETVALGHPNATAIEILKIGLAFKARQRGGLRWLRRSATPMRNTRQAGSTMCSTGLTRCCWGGRTTDSRSTPNTQPRITTSCSGGGFQLIWTSEWVFPADTHSGHIEKSSLKKQHSNACKLAMVAPFPFYTFRHTCLTRWAAYMDPYTLAYLAGHSDFSTTRRYVHPQVQTLQDAMERARMGQGRHSSGHNSAIESPATLRAVS